VGDVVAKGGPRLFSGSRPLPAQEACGSGPLAETAECAVEIHQLGPHAQPPPLAGSAASTQALHEIMDLLVGVHALCTGRGLAGGVLECYRALAPLHEPVTQCPFSHQVTPVGHQGVQVVQQNALGVDTAKPLEGGSGRLGDSRDQIQVGNLFLLEPAASSGSNGGPNPQGLNRRLTLSGACNSSSDLISIVPLLNWRNRSVST